MPSGDDVTVRFDAARAIADRYQIVERLGEGGFGTVYRARDTLLQRDVALKVLSGTTTAESRDRFLREAQATARLHHPNIVTIHDAGEDPSGLFLVLELVSGTALHVELRSGPLSPERARNIAAQTADALAAAHAAGIVHRDVKPANILVGADDRVKVADFGIARIAGAAQITVSGGVVGTPRYMAPEQVEGSEITPATDLFSLGIVLYEMLTGETPFRGETISEVVAGIARGQWQRPAAEVRMRAPQLWDVVERLLDRDPSRRGTAEEVARELHGSTADVQPASARPGRVKFARQLAAVAILLLIGAIAAFVMHRKPVTTISVPKEQVTTRVHLTRAKWTDVVATLDANPGQTIPKFSGIGLLAGIQVTIRDVPPSDIDLITDANEVDRAVELVKVIDSLGGAKFSKESNLFTGTAPSSRTISLGHDYPPTELITFIARAAGLPLVQDLSVARAARRTPTTDIRDAPWDRVVTTLIENAHLSLWRDEQVCVLESQQRRREREAHAQRMWLAFRLRRKDPAAVADSLRPLLGGAGELAYSAQSNHIVVLSTRERIEEIKRVMEMLDPEPRPRPPEKKPMTFTGDPISLSLRDAQPVDLVKVFGAISGLSIVLDPDVRGSVSLELNEVPWDNALDAILRSQGLAYRVEGTVMHVTAEAKLLSTPPIVATIHLAHEKPTFLRHFEEALKPALSIVLTDDPSGTLVIKGDPAMVEFFKGAAANLDSLQQ